MTATDSRQAGHCLLDEGKGPLAYKDDYGYVLYIMSGPEGLKETSDMLRTAGFSLAIDACVLVAHNNGCKFLRLDGDGPLIDFLPKFDW